MIKLEYKIALIVLIGLTIDSLSAIPIVAMTLILFLPEKD